jgi:hypothetical protein
MAPAERHFYLLLTKITPSAINCTNKIRMHLAVVGKTSGQRQLELTLAAKYMFVVMQHLM